MTRPPLVLTGGHHVLVLLHGHGDDPSSMALRRDELDPRGLATVVVPTGPIELPEGGFAWFGEDGSTADAEAMVDAIDAAVAEGAARATTDPDPRVVLVGYSQGAASALSYAVRTGAPELAGVATVAGWLPSLEGLDWAPRAGLPVLMVHPVDDEVVPLPLGRSSARFLEREGADLVWAEVDGDHRLTREMTATVASWCAALTSNP